MLEQLKQANVTQILIIYGMIAFLVILIWAMLRKSEIKLRIGDVYPWKYDSNAYNVPTWFRQLDIECRLSFLTFKNDNMVIVYNPVKIGRLGGNKWIVVPDKITFKHGETIWAYVTESGVLVGGKG